MSNSIQPDVLDRMIARLEEANARSYNQPSRADESSPRQRHDDGRQPPDSQAKSRRQTSWARRSFVAVVLLLVAASVFVTSFAGNAAYLDAVKLTFARWVNGSVRQTDRVMSPQGGDLPIPAIPREMEQRLQRMAADLADLQQRVEQLRTSQDQVRESGAETAAQLEIDRNQMMSDAASMSNQLKATQDQLVAAQVQLAEVMSSKSASSSRKSFRRKRLSPLSLSPRARSSVR